MVPPGDGCRAAATQGGRVVLHVLPLSLALHSASSYFWVFFSWPQRTGEAGRQPEAGLGKVLFLGSGATKGSPT